MEEQKIVVGQTEEVKKEEPLSDEKLQEIQKEFMDLMEKHKVFIEVGHTLTIRQRNK
jgi:hypothetical protein